MSLPTRIMQIGELERPAHYYITEFDECYFVGEYLTGGSTGVGAYTLSDVNQLISNFKKPLSRRQMNDWGYKGQAIAKIAKIFSGIWDWSAINSANAACIPMPSSKARSDPHYDNRMLQVLEQLCSLLGYRLDIRDCLSFSGKYPASHKLASGDRPSIEQLVDDLTLCPDAACIQRPPEYIFLFDDVITTGRHFKAAKSKLNESFPKARVIGVFVARRVFPDVTDDFDDFSDLF